MTEKPTSHRERMRLASPGATAPAEAPIKHGKITKFGNSQGIYLSQEVLNQAHFAKDEAVEIFVDPNEEEIILRKSKPSPGIPRLSIRALLADVEAPEKMTEIDWGAPVGEEVW